MQHPTVQPKNSKYMHSTHKHIHSRAHIYFCASLMLFTIITWHAVCVFLKWDSIRCDCRFFCTRIQIYTARTVSKRKSTAMWTISHMHNMRIEEAQPKRTNNTHVYKKWSFEYYVRYFELKFSSRNEGERYRNAEGKRKGQKKWSSEKKVVKEENLSSSLADTMMNLSMSMSMVIE